MSQLPDFIDRAKLGALADEHTREDDIWPVRRARRTADFLAGAAAYAALLDAETTEEWGVGPNEAGEPDQFTGTEGTARMVAARDSIRLFPVVVYSRRVLYGPWLPSDGGEKRG